MGGLLDNAGSLSPAGDATGRERQASRLKAVLVIDACADRGDVELHLLSIGDRPVILRVLESFADAGIRDVAIAVDPALVPRIRRALDLELRPKLELTYLACSPGEGLLGALASATEFAPDGPLLIHWACGLYRASLRSLLGGATVGPLDCVVLVDPPHARARVVELATERLSALVDCARADSGGSLAGVALVGDAARKLARGLQPGRGTDLDLLALVGRMADLGGQVRTLPATESWRASGAADSALDLNRFLLADLAADVPDTLLGDVDVDVQGPVQVDQSATVQRSTVRGPVVIGPRTRLVDAYVGPYTSIGADVSVEGAEVENSIVLDGTRISHVDRRLEASVLGPAATICRDFRLPRALRLRVGEGARVSLN